MSSMAASEWTTSEHALRYLARADAVPHRTEGEGVLLDHVSVSARRILDLGTGDGRLLALLRIDRPESEGVGFDAIVSCFAIHHLEHERKRSLYGSSRGRRAREHRSLVHVLPFRHNRETDGPGRLELAVGPPQLASGRACSPTSAVRPAPSIFTRAIAPRRASARSRRRASLCEAKNDSIPQRTSPFA